MKKLNLTCEKPDQSFKHFLLCPIEGCRKASEKYWHKQADRKIVINLIPVVDVDLDKEQINIDNDDLDHKRIVSDQVVFNQFFIPTMALGNDDNSPVTHTFLKNIF